MVPLTVGGKKGRFVIGLQSERTSVRAGFLEGGDPDAKVTIEAAGRPIGSVPIETGVQLPRLGADGILGYDVLRNYAIGFNWEGKIRLWPAKTETKELRDWVGSGAKSVSLLNRENLLFLPVTVKRKTFYLSITASSTDAEVTPDFADAIGFLSVRDHTSESPGQVEVPVESGVAGGFEAGGTEWPWLYANRIPLPASPDYGGHLRVVDFNRGRVVVDLTRDELTHLPVRGKAAVLASLSTLIRTPFEQEGDRTLLGNRPIAGWEPFEGAELLEYAGRPVGDWLKLMNDPAPQRLEAVAGIPKSLRDKALRIKLKDGRTANVRIGGA
ncbi:MAG: hypothetical protein ACO1SV_09635 [Fimbriimonas sp.]